MEHISNHLSKALNSEPAPPASNVQRTGSAFSQALETKKIKDCSIDELSQGLRYVMVKVGLRAANWPDDFEKQILLKHIFDGYGGHHVDEIKLAFDMAIGGKLDLDVNDVKCYENFSCLYFSTIMNAYREWAREAYKTTPTPQAPVKQLVYSIDPKKELLELIEMYKQDLVAGKLRVEYVLPSVWDSLLKFGLVSNPVNIVTMEDKRQAVMEFINSELPTP